MIPTALPTVGVRGAELTDADSGEVHVYAHPSKTVINLEQQKEKDKVQYLMFMAVLLLSLNFDVILSCNIPFLR